MLLMWTVLCDGSEPKFDDLHINPRYIRNLSHAIPMVPLIDLCNLFLLFYWSKLSN